MEGLKIMIRPSGRRYFVASSIWVCESGVSIIMWERKGRIVGAAVVFIVVVVVGEDSVVGEFVDDDWGSCGTCSSDGEVREYSGASKSGHELVDEGGVKSSAGVLS